MGSGGVGRAARSTGGCRAAPPATWLAERYQLDRHLLELKPAPAPDVVSVGPEPADRAVVAREHQRRRAAVLLQAPGALGSGQPLADRVIRSQLQIAFVGGAADVPESGDRGDLGLSAG